MPTICEIISLLISTGLFSCRFSQLEGTAGRWANKSALNTAPMWRGSLERAQGFGSITSAPRTAEHQPCRVSPSGWPTGSKAKGRAGAYRAAAPRAAHSTAPTRASTQQTRTADCNLQGCYLRKAVQCTASAHSPGTGTHLPAEPTAHHAASSQQG